MSFGLAQDYYLERSRETWAFRESISISTFKITKKESRWTMGLEHNDDEHEPWIVPALRIVGLIVFVGAVLYIADWYADETTPQPSDQVLIKETSRHESRGVALGTRVVAMLCYDEATTMASADFATSVKAGPFPPDRARIFCNEKGNDSCCLYIGKDLATGRASSEPNDDNVKAVFAKRKFAVMETLRGYVIYGSD
jgi:hypothetical protein